MLRGTVKGSKCSILLPSGLGTLCVPGNGPGGEAPGNHGNFTSKMGYFTADYILFLSTLKLKLFMNSFGETV